jgi:hypothetical protein
MPGIALVLLSPFAVWSAASPAADFVQQLGSPSFAKREEAARRLTALRQLAMPALWMGLRHADAEIRDRSRALLALALRSDLDIRIDALLEDPDCPEAQSLPCWGRFRTRFGAEPPVRRAFARMVREQPDLFRVLAQRPQELKEAFAVCLVSVEKRREKTGEVRPESMEALLFVALEGRDRLASIQLYHCLVLLSFFAPQPPEWRVEALPESEVFRALAEQLLRGSTDRNLPRAFHIARELELQDFIREVVKPEVRRKAARLRTQIATRNEICDVWELAHFLELKDELGEDVRIGLRRLVATVLATETNWEVKFSYFEFADRIDSTAAVTVAESLAGDKSVPTLTRAQTISWLCQAGAVTTVAALEKLFDADDVVKDPAAVPPEEIGGRIWAFPNSRLFEGETRLRDAALAASVFLSGQALADYGFPVLREYKKATPAENAAINFGFKDDASRQRAFRLWARRKVEHRKDEAARKADTEGDRLLRRLGSDSYAEREEAAERLRGLGERAAPLLKAGRFDPDPEVAARCRELLTGK